MGKIFIMKKPKRKKLNLRKLSVKLFQNLPEKELRMTLPTLFTLARIVLTPFIIYAMVHQHWGIAFFLFVTASITDVIDGNLARWFDQKTFLGACIDPIADKILLISCFATLAFFQSPLFSIPIWFVWLVVIKDSIIVFGGLALFLIKGYLHVQPTVLGKLTTFVQTCFIVWLFACYFFQWFPIKTYYTMLTLLSTLAIATLVQYFKMGLAQLHKK